MNEPIEERSVPSPPARPRRRPLQGGIFFPLILIFVGVMLLLNTMGVVAWSAWWRLWPLWPALLVLIGLDILMKRSPLVLRIVLALLMAAVLVGAGLYMGLMFGPVPELASVEESWTLGEVDRGDVTLDLGTGQLIVEHLEESGVFAEANLRGWLVDREPAFQREGGVAYLEIAMPEAQYWLWPGNWDAPAWVVTLTPRVPLKLDVHNGIGETILRLRQLRLEELTVDMGIGRIECTLPAGGALDEVRMHAGIGSIEVKIPEGVPVRIQADAGLGGVDIDESRFPERDDVYRSPECDTGEGCVDISLDVGIGGITVR